MKRLGAIALAAVLSSGFVVEMVLACSATATCGTASCSTPPGAWGQSCSSDASCATCTWTESCGTGCTETRTRKQCCPGSGQLTPEVRD